jgi:hypothetical protein
MGCSGRYFPLRLNDIKQVFAIISSPADARNPFGSHLFKEVDETYSETQTPASRASSEA